jgi:hypothetical protein
VITNLANGRFVTSVTPSVLEKDLRVTDNGDGTLTVLVLATGNATLTERTARPSAGIRAKSGSNCSSTTAARPTIPTTTSCSPKRW